MLLNASSRHQYSYLHGTLSFSLTDKMIEIIIFNSKLRNWQAIKSGFFYTSLMIIDHPGKEKGKARMVDDILQPLSLSHFLSSRPDLQKIF